ncbi:MAG TPA: hypothetical protein DGT21_02600 [Armatimonadetes bacterium]|nr:hypothetical protein [Armatimonadota bacterium]
MFYRHLVGASLSLVVIIMAASVVGAQQAGLPPRVIATAPEQFAANVDPGLTSISVTFDRPMTTQGPFGFGSLRWAGVYPSTQDARASWSDDGVTCTLPVTLLPDVTYALTVNTSKGREFVSADGIAALNFALVFATGERTEDDFPPYVVDCTPPQAAEGVDPALSEVTVTFNRPIAPGDHSWVLQQGSGQYPGYRGGPPPTLSADRLSATLPVRLAPNTVYSLGINDIVYFGYKDTKGRPLLPYGWSFKTR